LSGTIDTDELMEFSKHIGLTLTKDECKAAMSQLDLNGDGTIDFHEFTMWWLGGRPKLSPAMKQVLKAQKNVEKVVAAMKEDPVKEVTGSADKSSLFY
jgi:hypothetical protein